jgi:hypothetical protein
MKGVIVVTASLVVVGTAHAQSLQEQAQCATLAQKAFRQDAQEWDRENEQDTLHYSTISFSYEGHYNAKLHRCLILTARTYAEGSKRKFTAMSLYDVIERHYYAEYLTISDIPGVSCITMPKRDCSSADEFKKIVKEYMEE